MPKIKCHGHVGCQMAQRVTVLARSVRYPVIRTIMFKASVPARGRYTSLNESKKRSRKARKCLLCGPARAVWVPFRRRYIHVHERESLVCFVGFDLLTFLHDQLNLFTNWSLGDGKLKDFMIELELIAHRKMLQNLKRTAVSVIQFKFPA